MRRGGECLADCAELLSASLVDLTTMADVMEINATELCVELVEHAVITDAEFEFRAVPQAVVRECPEARAHFIHLFFHPGANGAR